MVHNWEPGVQYNLGDSAMYNGSKYNIIQAHRSQGDWAPDRTPALWGKVPGGGGGGHQQPQHCDPKPGHQQPQHHQQPGYQQPQQHQQPGYQQPQQPQQQPGYQPPVGQQPGGYQQPPPQQGGYKPVEVPKPDVKIHEEEKKTSWLNLSDERKKQLEIGGGIAAGAGLLAGGYLLWKKHDKDEDEKKDLIWGLQNWVTTSQERTQRYFQQGPTGPCTWILVKGKQVPEGAIVGGQEGGQTVYIARAFVEGGIHIGKAHAHCSKGACIGYGGDEEDYDTYEVLVGDIRALRWVDIQGDFKVEKLNGARPVEGGNEKNGDPLYVVQATYKGETLPGKISKKISAHIVKDGKEREIKDCRVLCYGQ